MFKITIPGITDISQMKDHVYTVFPTYAIYEPDTYIQSASVPLSDLTSTLPNSSLRSPHRFICCDRFMLTSGNLGGTDQQVIGINSDHSLYFIPWTDFIEDNPIPVQEVSYYYGVNSNGHYMFGHKYSSEKLHYCAFRWDAQTNKLKQAAVSDFEIPQQISAVSHPVMSEDGNKVLVPYVTGGTLKDFYFLIWNEETGSYYYASKDTLFHEDELPTYIYYLDMTPDGTFFILQGSEPKSLWYYKLNDKTGKYDLIDQPAIDSDGISGLYINADGARWCTTRHYANSSRRRLELYEAKYSGEDYTGYQMVYADVGDMLEKTGTGFYPCFLNCGKHLLVTSPTSVCRVFDIRNYDNIIELLRLDYDETGVNIMPSSMKIRHTTPGSLWLPTILNTDYKGIKFNLFEYVEGSEVTEYSLQVNGLEPKVIKGDIQKGTPFQITYDDLDDCFKMDGQGGINKIKTSLHDVPDKLISIENNMDSLAIQVGENENSMKAAVESISKLESEIASLWKVVNATEETND